MRAQSKSWLNKLSLASPMLLRTGYTETIHIMCKKITPTIKTKIYQEKKGKPQQQHLAKDDFKTD